MRFTTALSRFFTGAFVANAIPHLVNGVSGVPFPTPFASPPGVGDSPPLVNVFWASANLLIAYVLLVRTRPLRQGFSIDGWLIAAGFIATAAALSVTFG